MTMLPTSQREKQSIGRMLSQVPTTIPAPPSPATSVRAAFCPVAIGAVSVLLGPPPWGIPSDPTLSVQGHSSKLVLHHQLFPFYWTLLISLQTSLLWNLCFPDTNSSICFFIATFLKSFLSLIYLSPLPHLHLSFWTDSTRAFYVSSPSIFSQAH